jgi:leucyl-tRNA synthetase
VKPEQLTDEVFDHVFLGAPTPATEIPEATLKAMRSEFTYWYPFDLRVSGKDLIQNHLTFSIYNHAAIFPEVLRLQSVSAARATSPVSCG